MIEPGRGAGLGSTVSVLGMREMIQYAIEAGVDVRALMAELGVDPSVLADPDHRLSVRTVQQAWERAAELSGDAAFGLHVAERATIGVFEALDYALWASATFDEVLERLERFHRVIGDDLALQRVRTGKWIRVRRLMAHDRRQRAETVLALIAVRGRELCGRAFRVHEVCFTHDVPADVRPHRALFRCPVRFGCRIPEITFSADQLRLPVRTARPGLAIVLDRYLQEMLAKLPAGQTYRQRVEHAIGRTLHVGRPSLAATARALHASPRTVQRQLHELGMSHRELVDLVRRDMATRLLATSRLSVSEVAFLLGFEDVSGFRRAYRKWTGTSPSRGRRR